jgi:hypothetical protein
MEVATIENGIKSKNETTRASTKFTWEGIGKRLSSWRPDRSRCFPSVEGLKTWRTLRKSAIHPSKESHLLGLPYELRMYIWNYTITGHRVALYRERGPDQWRGRLTYGILDESHTRTPGRIVPLSVYTIYEMAAEIFDAPSRLNHDYIWDKNAPPRMKKIHLAALLKTCRLM